MQAIKTAHEAREFRDRIAAILSEAGGWERYEPQRVWLEKRARPSYGDEYTLADVEAVARIINARKRLMKGWDGYSVAELIKYALSHYLSDDDDFCVQELVASGATRLQFKEMRWLVGLCLSYGLEIRRIDPERDVYRDAAW